MQISTVIPTYQAPKLLLKNFPTILDSMRDGDEVVLVEDGNPDETLSWLSQEYDCQLVKTTPEYQLYEGLFATQKKSIEIKYVVNQQTLRFAGNSNRGVSLSRHPLIYLANNDVTNYPDTLEKLIRHFDNPKIFAVGCLEYDTQRSREESGKNKLWFQRGMFIHAKADDLELGPTAWASGGSGLFDRSKWEKLGGFDLDYYPAYWEDIDLSYRAKQKGWLVLFDPQARVDHNHETTNTDVFGQIKMLTISWKNADTFTWKHTTCSQKLSFILWRPYWWWQRRRIMKQLMAES